METTMRFLVDFRKRAEREMVEARAEAMSLGELLYFVLVRDGELEAV